jgi:hypothetical protein
MKRFIRLTVIATISCMTIASQLLPATAGDISLKNQTQSNARIKTALDKVGMKYEIDEDGDFRVIIRLKDDRTQLAWITSKTHKVGELEIREVISPGYLSKGALDAKVANQLLADSSNRTLGGWQIVKQKENQLALFSAKINADSTAEDLVTAIMVATYSADELEQSLSKEDKF